MENDRLATNESMRDFADQMADRLMARLRLMESNVLAAFREAEAANAAAMAYHELWWRLYNLERRVRVLETRPRL
jgi:hypothetical protein